MRVVVTVAQEGSVTRAASSLHQSSSAVSHTLLALESELGVDLFHRLPRGMTLTDAGVAFAASAQRALHEAEVARHSVDAIRGVVSGQVNVVTVLGYTVGLADLIGAFSRSDIQASWCGYSPLRAAMEWLIWSAVEPARSDSPGRPAFPRT